MKRFQDFYKKVNEQEDIDPENFQDETDLEIEPVGPSTADNFSTISKLKDQDAGGSLDDHFRKILEFQVQTKVFHWGTESFSEHKASCEIYDAVNLALDKLVEAYQGYVGRIKFAGQYTMIGYSDVDAFAWLNGIEEIVKMLRTEIEYSDIQNILDEIQAEISKFKYLLTLKK
jgi:DNA-binding ferritin-like protein